MSFQVSTFTITAGEMGVVKKAEPAEIEQVNNLNSKAGDETPKNGIKSMQEMARQLDYATSKCNSVESLFAVDLISRRNKMKTICELYMFEAPKTNGVPGREKLWRYVYYEPISRAKRLKQKTKWSLLDKAYLKQHMMNGIGQLSLLMLKLQTEEDTKHVKLRFCPDGLDNIMPLSMIDEGSSEESSSGNQEWAADIYRLLLLNIGDLCRYLCDLHQEDNPELHLSYYDRAQDYYTQAYLINPESGFAHNQLGNLSMKRNNGLDSIYYFLYSLAAKSPCPGAFVNLRQLMESQLVSFATLSGSFVYTPLHTFSHNFIKMLNQFFSDTPAPFGKCEKLCEETITSFVLLLADGVSTLDKGFMFRIVSICMMTVWQLLTTKSTITSKAVCFAIGIFVHTMKRLTAILKRHSKVKEVMDISSLDEDDTNSADDSAGTGESLSKSTSSSLPPDAKDQYHTSTVELDVEQEGQRFGKRRVLRNRPRELDDYYSFIHQDEYNSDWNDNASESTDYLRGSGSSLPSSDAESEEEGQSDDENDDEPNCYLEENHFDYTQTRRRLDSSEVSDISYQADIEIERKAAALKLSQSSDEVMPGYANGKDSSMKLKNVIEVDGLQACWAEVEPLIVAVLPFTRWLQSWLPIQHALAASTEKEVMEEFCQLFNLLESTNWSTALKQNWNNHEFTGEESTVAKEVELRLVRDWKNLADGKLDENLFSLELPEDLSMLGWNHLMPSNNVPAKCITENSIMVTRIGRLLVFGQWLVGTEAFAVIRSEKTFLVPSVEEYKRHMKKIQMEKFSRRLRNKIFPEDKEDDDGKNINGKYQQRRRRREYNNHSRNQDDKVYLVFDLNAVLKYLRIIQKMSRHSKFRIVLPFSVSRALDELKDGNEEGSRIARIANRWLERNSNASYRNAIQLLRKEDKVPVDNIQYPMIQTKESREFFDILESCNYIREQLKIKRPRPDVNFFNDTRDNYRVFYLTGAKDLLDSTIDLDRGFNPIAICRSAYIFLDRISRYQNRGRNRNRKNKANGHNGG